MAEFTLPDGLAEEPGPCPKCGGEGPVYTVRSQSDRGWWQDWKGCLSCVAPLAWASEAMDRNGSYLPLGKARRRG
ncbi:hypothetical protein [Magnetospira sp. QH-2]|uniref:hypothetical protein n=1 Tax=Magnetospira sp. (strain QH-2) TaxID=1288970 RepID=UPI0003E81ABE|nr:hypothetical protein [Magnetospira sp. QH-2]CCQ72256.1 protein of unknown function [Magnetospira sp. QH-2]